MALDFNQSLSEHFKLWEFTTSQVASRLEIDNTPPPEVIENLQTLCLEILEPAYNALGSLKILSGYHSPHLEAAIDGNPYKEFSEGYAVEIVALEASNLELAHWLQDHSEFDQIILSLGESGEIISIYVSYDPAGGRKELLQQDVALIND
jgi:zinc D-Ala-D-Ala carboxypeptidase